ncbi:MAG: DUF1080 domain-containing protein [Planctomycetales bacterium]|nr:DUF1080 domain-containing protein [Planctomycetales bacterium]
MRPAFALLSMCLCVCSSLSLAQQAVEMPPKLVNKLDNPSVSEPFERAMDKPWQTVKGDWQVENGVLRGKELESDKHAAVLSYQLPNRNSIIRFAFRVEGSTDGMHLSLNHKSGHLFRVVVTPKTISIQLDKDKKDPNSKVQVLATAKTNFEPEKWHTLQVEMKGKDVIVQTDSGVQLSASHDSLDVDKPNYRFIARGAYLTLDEIKIWPIK